ncbi:MAG: DNA-formamidopyrimidine glycosylase [Candidatus Izemoplasmatales bacterium]|nr:DNA-formamidopyrimidine glycosylase [Candidatus Izemoplasmatales bacterium]
MPELPEVETVKETLKNFLIGQKIRKVIAPYPNIIKDDLDSFKDKIIGQQFNDILRYGKYLLFQLDDYVLVSHLRMEGKYFIRNSLKELSKHEHVIFELDNGKFLSYHDVRKFGTMELVFKGTEFQLESLSKLGFEANDENADINIIYEKFRKANRPVKTVLLDQTVITGLGNIYVDETLFLTKIHPQEIASHLSFDEVSNLIKNARTILNKAIALGGTTIRTYQSSLGVDGRFQNELNVHTLVGKPCPVCSTEIIKIKVGGRGTYLCPNCQKRKEL